MWAAVFVGLGVQGCRSTSTAPVETHLNIWAMHTHTPGPDEWVTTLRGFASGIEFDAYVPLIPTGECMDHDGIDAPLSEQYDAELQVTLGAAGEWTMFQVGGWIEPSEPVPSGPVLPAGESVMLSVPELAGDLAVAAPEFPAITSPQDGSAIPRESLPIEWSPIGEPQIFMALSFYDGDGTFLLVHDCVLPDSGNAVLEPWTNAPASAATAVLRARYGHSASRTEDEVRYGLHVRATEIVELSIPSLR